MTSGSEAVARLLMEQVGHTVRAALRRKSGLTLADDDARSENVDALDVYQDALMRVWERIGDPSAADTTIGDLKAFATAVANNLWSDYLRQRHPRRTSLKNRLRYFLSHAPEYGLWAGSDHALMCGRRAWRYVASLSGEAQQAHIEKLREDLSWLPMQAKPVERYSIVDWNRYLAAVLRRVGNPVPFEDLVSLTAQVLDVQEDRTESIDAPIGSNRGLGELPGPTHHLPEVEAELLSSIARLWIAVKALRADYRCAYLLNVPGSGRSRGDIEAFVDLGVARVAELGAVLGLNDSQYAIAWQALPLSAADRADVAELATAEEKFYLLWKYLPLGDAVIARLLGIQQQQVLSRRVLALRELARMLDGARL